MKKSLIVYYSLQGFTKEIANIIGNKTNGVLHEILLEKPYTLASSATLGLIHARTGHSPLIKNKIPNLDEYDIIYIGAPIWWYTLTPPINTFIKENNLSNKIVVPFCTHGGNFGSYFKKFKEQVPNALIVENSDFLNEKVKNMILLEKKVTDFVSFIEKN